MISRLSVTHFALSAWQSSGRSTVNSCNVIHTESSRNCWFLAHLSDWLDNKRATNSIARVFLRVSSVLARSQQGVFFQDPLIQDVSRGSPMDGFMLCPGRRPLAADGRAWRQYSKYVNNVAGLHPFIARRGHSRPHPHLHLLLRHHRQSRPSIFC